MDTTIEGRSLALEIHAAFRELDRAWFSPSAPRRIAERLRSVRDRLDDASTEGEVGKRLVELKRELEGVDDVADRQSLVSLRTKVQPTYEKLVSDLAKERVSVPSLRPTNFKRNALHVGSAAAGVLALLLVPSWSWATGIACTFAGLAWTLETTRRIWPSVNDFCMRLFGATAHPHEAFKVNSATWYATALVVMSATHALIPCLAALAVLGFGDPAAAIIGRRFGKHELVHGRTVEGTFAFVLAGGLASLALLALTQASGLGVLALVSLVAGIAGALAELFSRRIDDNLSIPIVACGAAWATLTLVG